jgi:hypothetical protein
VGTNTPFVWMTEQEEARVDVTLERTADEREIAELLPVGAARRSRRTPRLRHGRGIRRRHARCGARVGARELPAEAPANVREALFADA